jgi:outer membrane protein with beta-barrel domain
MNARARCAVPMLLFVATAVCLALPASASAQHFGVKAGVNFASLTPEEDESPDISRRPGLVSGAWIRTPLNPRLSFQAEGLFSEKGVKFDATALGVDGDIDVRVRYFEIPLLAGTNFGTARSTTRVFVIGGAAPAFKISARSKARIAGEEQTHNDSDQIESFDVGLVGGVGVEFGRALVEARYTHGLRRINKDHNDPNDNVQNRVFSVIAGFRFR